MATITLVVEVDGVPVEDASVFVGEAVGKALVTDANGEIVKTVAADYAIATTVLIDVGGVRRGSYGSMLLEAGNTYVFEIGRTAP